VAGCRECGNELQGSIKCLDSRDDLTSCQGHKKDSGS
jgi:hypothetical protein